LVRKEISVIRWHLSIYGFASPTGGLRNWNAIVFATFEKIGHAIFSIPALYEPKEVADPIAG